MLIKTVIYKVIYPSKDLMTFSSIMKRTISLNNYLSILSRIELIFPFKNKYFSYII